MNFAHLLIIAAATPSPIPTDKVPDASKVSPGLPGFIMIFLLAVAVILLARSMNKRIRRVRLRAEEQELEEMASAGDDRSDRSGEASGDRDGTEPGTEQNGEPGDEQNGEPDDGPGGRQSPQ